MHGADWSRRSAIASAAEDLIDAANLIAGELAALAAELHSTWTAGSSSDTEATIAASRAAALG
eukprot:5311492-Heterocapsa_arctica.AAC.1